MPRAIVSADEDEGLFVIEGATDLENVPWRIGGLVIGDVDLAEYMALTVKADYVRVTIQRLRAVR